MADGIVRYEHSNTSGTIDFGSVEIDTQFPGRTVHPKGGSVILSHDPDKKVRQFTLRQQMTGEEYFDFHALIYATTTLDATYPRLVHVKLEGDGTHDWADILVLPGPVRAIPLSKASRSSCFIPYKAS